MPAGRVTISGERHIKMASSLEELLAEEGFKGSRRRSVTRSRSSFHYGAPSEPLHSLEDRLCKSSERIKTQRTKSDSAASRLQIGSAKNRLKNEKQTEKKSCSITGSGKGSDYNSSEYMPMPRYERVLEDVYSDQVSNGKRGKEKCFNELVEKPVKDSNMLRKTSGNRKNSYTRSNSKSLEEDGRNNKNSHQSASDSGLALDEVAVQALVSILNGYIQRFLKDEEFRSLTRHNCFSSLNFIQLEEENNNTETKVITSLEQAIETIEQAAEEPISATYLKRATMQLSIIAGLSLNDLKYGYTYGIPNYKLSACAHLYLSVVYLIQRKNKVSAKHLLQVFCDSPFQARTILLPELWEHLFSPHLSHLKAWYNQKEAEILVDTPSKTRRLKLLQKVYNEHLDSGTHIFAVYYKDWLTEGAESPTIPSIGIPSLSVSSTTSRRGSSLGHSSESASSSEPFSPQPMVSKKLYDSVFGSSNKSGVCEVEDEDSKDEDSLESCVRGSYGSTIVKQTLIYESETIKFTDQNTEDFTPSVPVGAFHPVRKFSFLSIFFMGKLQKINK